MDIWMEIYHRICFPFYGMPYVKRSDYISIMDRAKLPYLNILQKLYCMYCGYGNGVLRYWAQIAGKTEHYRCGIQHKRQANSTIAEHQKYFAKYGNEHECKKKYGK